MKKLLLFLSIIVLSKFGNSQQYTCDTLIKTWEFPKPIQYTIHKDSAHQLFKWICDNTEEFIEGGNNRTFHSVYNVWIDSTGCRSKDIFHMRVKNKLIEITEQEYYKHNKIPHVKRKFIN